MEIDKLRDIARRKPNVRVVANDYYYIGHLVSVFEKLSGQWRCVVEDEHGRLFIHNPDQIHGQA
jgi:hypothetical protein